MTPDRSLGSLVVGVVLVTLVVSGPAVPGVTIPPQSEAMPVEAFHDLDHRGSEVGIDQQLAYDPQFQPTSARLVPQADQHAVLLESPVIAVQTGREPAVVRVQVAMPTLSYAWTDTHTQPAETAARVRFDTEAMPSVSTTPQQSQYTAQLRVTIEQANQTYMVIETGVPVEETGSR
jgi:hypothetical protein